MSLLHRVPKHEEEPSRHSDEPQSALTGSTFPFGNPNEYRSEDPSLSDRVADCGCSSHYDKVELDSVYPLPAKFVYEGLFGERAHKRGNSLALALKERRKLLDLEDPVSLPGEEDALRAYQLKYRVPVSNPILKEKDTPCIETIKVLKADDHLCYVVDVTAKTPNVPYGDSFEMRTRYCIMAQGAGSCRVKLSITTHFLKSIMLKGIIKSASMKGFSEYRKIFVRTLEEASKPVVTAGSGDGRLSEMEQEPPSKEEGGVYEGPSGILASFFSMFGFDVASPAVNISISLIWYLFLCVACFSITFTVYALYDRQTSTSGLSSILRDLESYSFLETRHPQLRRPLSEKKNWHSPVLEEHEEHYVRLVRYTAKLSESLETLLRVLKNVNFDLLSCRLVNRLSDDWLGCKDDPSEPSCGELRVLLEEAISGDPGSDSRQ
jgi:hypothetical protein